MQRVKPGLHLRDDQESAVDFELSADDLFASSSSPLTQSSSVRFKSDSLCVRELSSTDLRSAPSHRDAWHDFAPRLSAAVGLTVAAVFAGVVAYRSSQEPSLQVASTAPS